MGQPTPCKSSRRDANWWAPLNNAYREQIELLGSKPDRSWLESWFESNGKATWPVGTEPSIQQAWDHCKCLRTLGQARDYFRQYRARKKEAERVDDRQAPTDRAPAGPDSGEGVVRSRKRPSYDPETDWDAGLGGGALGRELDDRRQFPALADMRLQDRLDTENEDTQSEDPDIGQPPAGDRHVRSHSPPHQWPRRRSAPTDKWPSDAEGSYYDDRSGRGGRALLLGNNPSDAGGRAGQSGGYSYHSIDDDAELAADERGFRLNSRNRPLRHGPRQRRASEDDRMYDGEVYGREPAPRAAVSTQGLYRPTVSVPGPQLSSGHPPPAPPLQWPQSGLTAGLPSLVGSGGGSSDASQSKSSLAASLAAQQQVLLLQLQSLQQQQMQLQQQEQQEQLQQQRLNGLLGNTSVPAGAGSSHDLSCLSPQQQAQLLSLLNQSSSGGAPLTLLSQSGGGAPLSLLNPGGGGTPLSLWLSGGGAGGLGSALGMSNGSHLGSSTGGLGMGGGGGLGLSGGGGTLNGFGQAGGRLSLGGGGTLSGGGLGQTGGASGGMVYNPLVLMQQPGGFGGAQGYLLQQGLSFPAQQQQQVDLSRLFTEATKFEGSGGKGEDAGAARPARGLSLAPERVHAGADGQGWGSPVHPPNLLLQSLIAAAACRNAAALQQKEQQEEQQEQMLLIERQACLLRSGGGGGGVGQATPRRWSGLDVSNVAPPPPGGRLEEMHGQQARKQSRRMQDPMKEDTEANHAPRGGGAAEGGPQVLLGLGLTGGEPGQEPGAKLPHPPGWGLAGGKGVLMLGDGLVSIQASRGGRAVDAGAGALQHGKELRPGPMDNLSALTAAAHVVGGASGR